MLVCSPGLDQASAPKAVDHPSCLPLSLPQVTEEMKQEQSEKSEKPESPSISIAMSSLNLRKGTEPAVTLRIENTTGVAVNLEGSSFLLIPEGLDFEKTNEGYSALARVWGYLANASGTKKSAQLQPGEVFQRKIRLTKLIWNLSRSSVDLSFASYPAGNLFHEVPPGRYELSFLLEGRPQKVIAGVPMRQRFRSNELRVSVMR